MSDLVTWVTPYSEPPTESSFGQSHGGRFVSLADLTAADEDHLFAVLPAGVSAPANAVIKAGDIHSTPLGLWGPVFIDVNGFYYGMGADTRPVMLYANNGPRSVVPLIGARPDGQPWTLANIAAEMGATNVALQQAIQHNKSKGMLADLLSMPAFQIAMAIVGAAQAIQYFGIVGSSSVDAMGISYATAAEAQAANLSYGLGTDGALLPADAAAAAQAAQIVGDATTPAAQAAQIASDAAPAAAKAGASWLTTAGGAAGAAGTVAKLIAQATGRTGTPYTSSINPATGLPYTVDTSGANAQSLTGIMPYALAALAVLAISKKG